MPCAEAPFLLQRKTAPAGVCVGVANLMMVVVVVVVVTVMMIVVVRTYLT